MVKIWSAKPTKGSDSGASEAKKARSDSTAAKPVTRTPLRTLGGHKEAISGVAWQKEEGFFYIISYLTISQIVKENLTGLVVSERLRCTETDIDPVTYL